MTSGRGADERNSGLDRIRRRYPRWRIWHGHTTGAYWALPPRDHPTLRVLRSTGVTTLKVGDGYRVDGSEGLLSELRRLIGRDHVRTG